MSLSYYEIVGTCRLLLRHGKQPPPCQNLPDFRGCNTGRGGTPPPSISDCLITIFPEQQANMQRILLNFIEGNPPFKHDMLTQRKVDTNEQQKRNNTI